MALYYWIELSMPEIILGMDNPLYYNVYRFMVHRMERMNINPVDGLSAKLELLRYGIRYEHNEFRLTEELLSFILLNRSYE